MKYLYAILATLLATQIHAAGNIGAWIQENVATATEIADADVDDFDDDDDDGDDDDDMDDHDEDMDDDDDDDDDEADQSGDFVVTVGTADPNTPTTLEAAATARAVRRAIRNHSGSAY